MVFVPTDIISTRRPQKYEELERVGVHERVFLMFSDCDYESQVLLIQLRCSVATPEIMSWVNNNQEGEIRSKTVQR
jgi:hypothetical protein